MELDELETELRVHLPKRSSARSNMAILRENSEYRAALDRKQFVKGAHLPNSVSA